MLSYNLSAYGPSASSVTINNAQTTAAQALNTAQQTQTLLTQETSRAEAAETQIQNSIPATLPYDFTFSTFDPLSDSQVLGGSVVTKELTIPATATGSMAKCGTPPTNSTSQFNINVNGSLVGTCSFPANSPTGSFTIASPVTLNPGDVLEVVADATTFDTTIGDVLITLVSQYPF